MTAVIFAGNVASPWGAWDSSPQGVSDAANTLRNTITQFVRDFSVSAVWNARYSAPHSQLIDLYRECRLANWDQGGAMPITIATLETAMTLLYSLPTTVAVPDFLPEPSGRIGFEWFCETGHVYVLSVGADRQLEFAGLFGPGTEIHGRCGFTGTMPSMVLDHLKELFRR